MALRSTSLELFSRKLRADGSSTKTPDKLLVEEPLTIQLDGTTVSSTMRTPGHDFELAVGFCHTEGLLHGAPVTGIRYCSTGSALETDFNVVTVETGGKAPEPTPRLGSTTSSCGICGSDAIEELTETLRVLPPHDAWDTDLLLNLPELIRGAQGLFDVTGSSHAAGAVDRNGEVIVVREDIGRHNAVDKVIGRMLLDDELPAPDHAIFVSGRASFEMIQKAWAAGFTALVSVSGPSALAVQTARRAGLTLLCFVRNGAGTLYNPG
ncbi:MAG: formate dehydrogenase accessory sulfurtransferase FdhD [Acidimicrobiales bacterium]|nr:formate dehydrogenase accessory sulfurtransferase FdhD [Acidimicrobiales bacterium]